MPDTLKRTVTIEVSPHQAGVLLLLSYLGDCMSNIDSVVEGYFPTMVATFAEKFRDQFPEVIKSLAFHPDSPTSRDFRDQLREQTGLEFEELTSFLGQLDLLPEDPPYDAA